MKSFICPLSTYGGTLYANISEYVRFWVGRFNVEVFILKYKIQNQTEKERKKQGFFFSSSFFDGSFFKC